MKTKMTVLYSFSELSEEAKNHALETARQSAMDCPDSLDGTCGELLDSLKAICDASNLRLRDYSYGAYDRGHKVLVGGEMEDESGPRALAWFLRVLMRAGYERPRRFSEMQFPGICGFTGVCYDEDIAETVWKNLLEGETVRHSFDAVSWKLCTILEGELDYLTSDEWLVPQLEDMGEVFTVEGREDA